MQNRSWKSWARPGGWGCRKSFQHFRGTGTAHDRPWFYGDKTTQALLTTDRFVLPQMFGKPGEMMWNAVSGVRCHVRTPSSTSTSVFATVCIFDQGMMFYSVSKSIDMDYQEARKFENFGPAALILTEPWQGEEGGTHQALVFASQSPVWIQGVWCLLGGEKKGLVSPFPKIKIQKTWRYKTRPNKALWRVQFIRIQWSLHLRPYVADFDLCRWTDRWRMDDTDG